MNLVQRAAIVTAGDFEQHELRLSLGAVQVLLQVVQPLEMRRATKPLSAKRCTAAVRPELPSALASTSGLIPLSLKLDPIRRTTGRLPSLSVSWRMSAVTVG